MSASHWLTSYFYPREPGSGCGAVVYSGSRAGARSGTSWQWEVDGIRGCQPLPCDIVRQHQPLPPVPDEVESGQMERPWLRPSPASALSGPVCGKWQLVPLHSLYCLANPICSCFRAVYRPPGWLPRAKAAQPGGEPRMSPKPGRLTSACRVWGCTHGRRPRPGAFTRNWISMRGDPSRNVCLGLRAHFSLGQNPAGELVW